MAALIHAALDPAYSAQIKRVISNNPDAPALGTARRHDIPAIVVDHRDHATREEHEAALARVLNADKPDFICMAGYMRILSADFVRKYAGRLINIHPSLLPSFRGLDTHERVLESGARIHGATVHFVTEGVDEGPVIAQAALAVHVSDTVDTLSARVLEQENLLYPHALALLAAGKVRWSGGRAVFSDATLQGPDSVLFSPPLHQKNVL